MQAARVLPLLRRAAHGGNRCPSGRPRDPVRAGAPMGALVADSTAPFVRRPAATARAAVAGASTASLPAFWSSGRALNVAKPTPARSPSSSASARPPILNIHLHCLVLDGVYLNRDGAAVFHEARISLDRRAGGCAHPDHQAHNAVIDAPGGSHRRTIADLPRRNGHRWRAAGPASGLVHLSDCARSTRGSFKEKIQCANQRL